MIEVKRTEYPERVIHYRGGRIPPKTVPAHYVCYYKFGGRQIAYYDSRDDCIYLNSRIIDRLADGTRKREGKVYDRALRCGMAEAYKELFEMLGADEKTRMSEYCDVYI